MIISVSRRTDIPAFYADWFFQRLGEGEVLVRNPVNPSAVRVVSLRPDDVDGFVFWSKNPEPMLSRLNELSAYRYYFQFTLTPYGRDIEPGVPDKPVVVETFRRLADIIGPERMVWRYDPMLLNSAYPTERHLGDFTRLAEALRGCTGTCTISFVDAYRNTKRNAEQLALEPIGDSVKQELVRAFVSIAAERGISLNLCAEDGDYTALGAGRARCVDAGLFNALWGLKLPVRKDRNQRPLCRCHESTDIGAYNTCPGGCLYCYANYAPTLSTRTLFHDAYR